MHMDNPDELVAKITGDILGTIKNSYETKEQQIYMVDA
eukprot:CAMPEP_0176344290 /NCGR_PEP_ID=MMETSP0126-20121128/4593_1 /TAXON_ID=141414 ORGANISM="Strombidinopsis acuminatum, Strain SPMC142" /NCGR_SAMPLE_ID=MMETSP0126 /ASSEMBLY_ACC=CAM_ASM_000229 /LENGTH=37 /DNA_ID= /DNA_START= /DNA_END= /DNA_ORIENTATION=